MIRESPNSVRLIRPSKEKGFLNIGYKLLYEKLKLCRGH